MQYLHENMSTLSNSNLETNLHTFDLITMSTNEQSEKYMF